MDDPPHEFLEEQREDSGELKHAASSHLQSCGGAVMEVADVVAVDGVVEVQIRDVRGDDWADGHVRVGTLEREVDLGTL